MVPGLWNSFAPEFQRWVAVASAADCSLSLALGGMLHVDKAPEIRKEPRVTLTNAGSRVNLRRAGWDMNIVRIMYAPRFRPILSTKGLPVGALDIKDDKSFYSLFFFSPLVGCGSRFRPADQVLISRSVAPLSPPCKRRTSLPGFRRGGSSRPGIRDKLQVRRRTRMLQDLNSIS